MAVFVTYTIGPLAWLSLAACVCSSIDRRARPYLELGTDFKSFLCRGKSKKLNEGKRALRKAS